MQNPQKKQIQQAAARLKSARKVLLSTGAGMSAESHIPTYRDTYGRWRDFTPFTQKGLIPEEFANPIGYRERPQHAWAFHEYLRRLIAKNQPHEGYAVITRWLKELPEAFLLTTNIDGYHLRSGAPEVKLCERYGSLWELQCLTPCQKRFWPDSRVPLCELDEDKMESSSFPTCPYCGGISRPRILMSHDQEFLEKEYDWKRFTNFQESAEPDLLIVIGTTLWFSWPEGAPTPDVISINPDPKAHEHYNNAIAIEAGAKEALLAIDQALRQG